MRGRENVERKVYEVKPIAGRLKNRDVTVTVPGSKSITNRALLLATLAEGESLLCGALFSEDSRFFLQCIQTLGFETVVEEQKRRIRVKGLGGLVPVKEAALYVGSAGTAARFLTAFLGLSEGSWHFDASGQMRRRPMQPLLQKLEEMGTKVAFEGQEGHFPFRLEGCRTDRREVSVDIQRSSQFLSALLISSCLAPQGLRVAVEGTHGMAYVDMTVKMMRQFGMGCERTVSKDGQIVYEVRAGQRYRAREYGIEPDLSAAAYFFAMAALLGVRVTVPGARLDGLQGDAAFLGLLERMGCRVGQSAAGIVVEGPADGKLAGLTADMSACSDQAITLAALAPFAEGPVTITGIGHIRYQESDRLAAMETELSRLGIRCVTTQDSITIWPGKPQPALVETYEDHRMAMGFALIGLRAEGIRIADPDCCKKTFENYFEVLEEAAAGLTA